MSVELPTDAQARLDAHLDAVERALLAAGRSRQQRRAVVDDLETQVMDMLASQSAAPTLVDVDVVLSRLDPAAAYGDGSTERPTVSQTARVDTSSSHSLDAFIKLVRLILFIVIVPLISIFIVVAIASLVWNTKSEHNIARFLLYLIVTMTGILLWLKLSAEKRLRELNSSKLIFAILTIGLFIGLGNVFAGSEVFVLGVLFIVVVLVVRKIYRVKGWRLMDWLS